MVIPVICMAWIKGNSENQILEEAWDNYDDMIDGIQFKSKLESFPESIQKRLEKYGNGTSSICDKSLYTVYRDANANAIRFQKINNYIISGFIVAIALAILGALCQDLWFEHYIWLIFEIVGVIAALTLLFYQKIFSHFFRKIKNYHHLWVIERHKAERCRFLKFSDLLWPEPGGYPGYYEKLSEINSIHLKEDIDKWIVGEGITPHQALAKIEEKIENKEDFSHDYSDVFRYYLCRRLFLQAQYYKSRIKRFQTNNYAWVKYFLTGLTIAALGAEILHIIIVFSGIHVMSDLYLGIRIGAIILLLVALIPVISSCLQTFTFARKFLDQADNYTKFFSVLFQLLENNLMGKGQSSLIEDFMAYERNKAKESSFLPLKNPNSTETYNSGDGSYDPGKKIDEILESFIGSCHTRHMVPEIIGAQISAEMTKIPPDSEYTIDAIIKNAPDNPLKVLKVFFQCEDTMEQEHQSWVSMMWSAEWI